MATCPACQQRPATGRHHRGTASLCAECFQGRTAAELDALPMGGCATAAVHMAHLEAGSPWCDNTVCAACGHHLAQHVWSHLQAASLCPTSRTEFTPPKEA